MEWRHRNVLNFIWITNKGYQSKRENRPYCSFRFWKGVSILVDVSIHICYKQNRSTEGCSKLKRSVDMTSSGKMVSTLEQMQVPNGTGPGVRRSKRPLLASRTRCNGLWKPPKFGNKVKIGNKVQFGNRFANWCNAWSIEGVIIYGHVPECHVTFGRGRLHNVWWDPHIDHKTSWGTISNVPWHIPVRGAYMKVVPP